MKTKYLVNSALALLFLGFFVAVHHILMPFILAFILAYFLRPVCQKAQNKLGETGGAVVTVVGFFTAVAAFIALLVPIIQTQLVKFSLRVPYYFSKFWEKAQSLLSWLKEVLPPDQVEQQLYKISYALSSSLDNMTGVLLKCISRGMAFFTTVSLLLIVPLVLFYFLMDWNKITCNLTGLIPHRFKKTILSLTDQINKALAGFIRGQISVCLILGLLYSFGLTLTRLELGALVGMVIGVLAFVPYMGFLFGVILAVLLALMQGASLGQWLAIGGVFAIGQLADAYFITPHFLGKNVGLHPVWIIFALLAGGALLGFVGVLLAVPLACIIKVLIQYMLERYKKTKFYTR